MFMFEISLSNGDVVSQSGFSSHYYAEVAVEDLRDFVEQFGVGIIRVLIREEG